MSIEQSRPVNSVVCTLMMFSNAIVDITIPHRSFVLSQSRVKVSVSLADVGTTASCTEQPWGLQFLLRLQKL